MTTEEAQIILLEDALRQAQSTVEFLHGCLTDPQYQYSYPEMTLAHLDEWEQLAPRGGSHLHSMYRDDCPQCKEHATRSAQKHEAEKVLGIR